MRHWLLTLDDTTRWLLWSPLVLLAVVLAMIGLHLFDPAARKWVWKVLLFIGVSMLIAQSVLGLWWVPPEHYMGDVYRIIYMHVPQVWMALDRRAWRPKPAYPPLRIVRYTGKALSAGVETHRIEGRPVKVYDVAKTLADCFKYRNKVGLDVALEALRAAWREKRFTMDELDGYAAICRVQRVMRPYLEALAA